MNLDRRTQVAPPHAGHDVAPMSKHASQSRHNARRRRGRCSDSAVLRVWRMTRTLSDLIKLSRRRDRKSTRLNSSHLVISYAVFCLKKKKTKACQPSLTREPGSG